MGVEFSPVSLWRLTCRGMPRDVSRRESPPMLLPLAGGSGTVVKLGELMMILELHRQGLTVSAIARQLGMDRKTIRRYIARGLEPPTYGPRPPQQRSTDPYLPYLRERLAAYPGLTAVRLWRELRERGYGGGYTAVKRTVREIRPEPVKPFEVRFETPPGTQAQVDLARFEVEFGDEPGVTRIVWLFSLVLGFSRLIWARFVVHQDLQTILRCHMAALEAIGGAPQEILYDRMKTAVIGEDADGLVVYNRGLLDLARHYGFQPRACRPYRPKTKGKVERPFRYIREDFFLGGLFRNLDDLNAQLHHWLDTVANPRVHATTQRVVNEAFAEEKPALKALPVTPYRTVLKLERRVSHEGMVSVGGNLYSVPDTTRRRILDVHVFADEICIFENGVLIATHVPLEGRDQKHVDPDHRKILSPPRRRQSDGKPIVIRRAGDQVARRSLDFYDAVGRRLAEQGGTR
jgi:transposase